jgi:hypothetical protein
MLIILEDLKICEIYGILWFQATSCGFIKLLVFYVLSYRKKTSFYKLLRT